MFDSMPFFIKKTKFFPNPVLIPIGMISSMIYIMSPIIVIFLFYIGLLDNINSKNATIIIVFLGIVIIWWFFILNKIKKIKNLKNLKYNGGGMLKKAKVTAIKKVNFNQKGKGRNEIRVYYFEAEDGGMTYYSNGYTKGTLLGTSISELQLLYATYGFTFSENHNQKEDLLRKIDEEIAVKEHEIENSLLFSKTLKRLQLGRLKKDKKTASDGYTPPYREINGNRVTVGDLVDVYLDPINPEKYRIDTEFLF